MSTINVTNLSGRGGATPNLPDGANITGVATATTFSGTLDGSLKTTGTPTLGLGVTINSSGLVVSGVATAGILSATTLYGDGSNLTGVGESIAPWNYNPDPNDSLVTVDTGIGITFNKKVLAGSGTATLKIVNAGVAGTTIQSWGVSSCTFNIQDFTMGSLVSTLVINKTYQLDIPEGFIVSSTGTNYVGTAYTFATQSSQGKLWVWGGNQYGELAINNQAQRSSPVQVPGTWDDAFGTVGHGIQQNNHTKWFIKPDGRLFGWGNNNKGQIGDSTVVVRSSPVQVGSDTTWKQVSGSYNGAIATKTDGTLWQWGFNSNGQLGQNNTTDYSSPKQVPGTTWLHGEGGYFVNYAVKTDGTLWAMGRNAYGDLGLNQVHPVKVSSPIQIPGTTWTNKIAGNTGSGVLAIKSDGTLWSWGYNSSRGQLGLNDRTDRSSPTQVPGTSWSDVSASGSGGVFALRTDGTLWAWGNGSDKGVLGLNVATQYSSPVQIPGTNWSQVKAGYSNGLALKTDGTLWSWGNNGSGQLGLSNRTQYSSPVQIGSSTEWSRISSSHYASAAIQDDQTP